MKQNLFGKNVTELQDVLVPLGLPKFRAKQIAQWMYEKGAMSFDEMTNLSKDLRAKLSETFEIFLATPKDILQSKDGKTSKYLLAFADGTAVESVLMRQPYGNSICISTQAGCAMGCAFCASTLHGRARDLTGGEMLAETVFIDQLLRKEGQKVDTMVLMGSGEPLMNYDNVLAFLHLVHDEAVLGMSYRSITLSTSGIVPNIYPSRTRASPFRSRFRSMRLKTRCARRSCRSTTNIRWRMSSRRARRMATRRSAA